MTQFNFFPLALKNCVLSLDLLNGSFHHEAGWGFLFTLNSKIVPDVVGSRAHFFLIHFLRSRNQKFLQTLSKAFQLQVGHHTIISFLSRYSTSGTFIPQDDLIKAANFLICQKHSNFKWATTPSYHSFRDILLQALLYHKMT